MKDRGFVILAQNTATTDYVACAYTLADSIRRTMPSMPVAIITDNQVDSDRFDYVIPLPRGDTDPHSAWKLSLDSQIYAASPFTQTIKLESDLYIPRSIEHWFDLLENRSLNICTTIRNHRNQISENRFYRATIDNNKLPDTYNAITYFARNSFSSDFFLLVQDIFTNWDAYTNQMLISKNEPASTDIVYAIAADIMGRQNCTLPQFQDFSMIHMKSAITGYITRRWHDQFVYEILPSVFRINSVPVQYPLHYHHKEFASVIDRELHA